MQALQYVNYPDTRPKPAPHWNQHSTQWKKIKPLHMQDLNNSLQVIHP